MSEIVYLTIMAIIFAYQLFFKQNLNQSMALIYKNTGGTGAGFPHLIYADRIDSVAAHQERHRLIGVRA